MLRLALLIALLLPSTLGCASRDLDWEVGFEPRTLEAQAARLDARILRGACPGTETLWDETIHPGSANDDPPTLPEGTYCLAAAAGNTACEWIASGEQTVVLPTDERVVVTLMAQTAESNCSMEMCQTDGTCAGGAGPPATLCAAGMCVQSCTSDCSVTCTGGSCDQTCGGGVTTDCDFNCTGGECNIVCEGGSDCTAACLGGGCNFECRGGLGDCVFSCAGGGCNFVCDDPDDCTTSCSTGCIGP